MKKKVLAALLASCMVLSSGAISYAEEKETQQTETAEEEKEAETEEETEDKAEETEAQEEKQEEKTEEKKEEEKEEKAADYEYQRIVSVKDPIKYVKLAKYKGLKLERTVQIVEDADVDSAIQAELAQNPDAANDAVQEGDTVIVDYVGTRNGEEFEGGTADGFWMVINKENGTEGIIGMLKGETKELKGLPGVDAAEGEGETVYQVTLRSIYRTPELTDEWVAANTDSKTVAEYRKAMKEKLQEQAILNAELLMQDQAWQEFVSDSKIKEFPEEDLEAARQSMRAVMETYAAQAGLTLEEMLEQQNYDQETYENDIDAYAKAKLTQNLLVQAILDEENIDMNDDTAKKCQTTLETMYGMTLAEMLEAYGRESIDQSLALMRVEQFLSDEAEITDNVAQGDTVGVEAGE